MKIRIITHDDERIIVKNTIIKLGVNPFDTEGSKVPISLFKDKGDILAAKGASNPATIKAGSDGQVLISDSNEEAGVKWETIKFGTISLLNSESFTVPSGMVVTPGTESGTFRIAKSADTENLYITSENIPSGKQGILYAINGIICIVRVTEGAIAIGDKLAVSATDGVAEAATGDHFAIAVTGKSAGQIGTVSCILVNKNGTTIDVPGGGTGRQTLTSNNILVGDGVDPIKLIPTKSGAFYATGDNAEPSFNTLPVPQGGTGRSTLTTDSVLVGNGTDQIKLFPIETSASNIKADGTASAGSSGKIADAAHVHPYDDSGWINLTLLNGWAVYTDWYGIAKYRKIGNFVEIILNSIYNTSSKSIRESKIAELPAGYGTVGDLYASAYAPTGGIHCQLRLRYSSLDNDTAYTANTKIMAYFVYMIG